MPIYEIFCFSASDAFVADSSAALKPAADFLGTVEGCLSIYAGLAEEEKTGYLVLEWESYEHHEAFTKRPGYPQIVNTKPILGDGERKMYHVDFIESPIAAITAPATEILTMTLKEGKTKADLAAALAVLGPKITAEGAYKPLAWGETREEPEKTFYLFLGWESSKRHFEVVGHSSYETPIQNLFAAVDIRMLHASFKKVV